MTPTADHGEDSYVGGSRLAGKVAIITGGDSGIGRAVAIAFAREGADIILSFLKTEQNDAEETARWVKQAGRRIAFNPRRRAEVEILSESGFECDEEVRAPGRGSE
jgi:NAD(P)-dependent dehydrogenase (short-subunit alcohol dehydrogenase family)